MTSRVIVLGGDGFCGWPTSLRLSSLGYQVTIVDNLSRRRIDDELGCNSLTPIQPMERRLSAWSAVTDHAIEFVNLDLTTDYGAFLGMLQRLKPHAIVHFAEQRSAPYSMKSPGHKQYTVNNNINATHNVLCAVVESGLDIHVVHLGSTGVYGYGAAGLPIPEGYLPVSVDVDGVSRHLEIMHPADPGSVYHMTKTQDALMFYYYNKNDDLRITDLHQGVVWGTNTPETLLHEDLINRFDYDGDYGTVLNRFLMQAAVGHPLTVYGTGGQTRAFIHIRDTTECVRLAIENPPATGERVSIFNQAAETARVEDLARKVAHLTDAEIRYYGNPRKEAPRNELDVTNYRFRNLGLDPITLDDALMLEVRDIALKYRARCDVSKILSTSKWTSGTEIDLKGSSDTSVGAGSCTGSPS